MSKSKRSSGVCSSAAALALCASLVAFPAQAQPNPTEPCSALQAAAQAQPEPFRLPGPGQVPGMWFPMPTARLILCQVERLGVERALVLAGERELHLWDTQLRFMAEQRDLAVQAEAASVGVVAASDRRARAAEQDRDRARADRDSFWRSPWLWTGVGVVTAVVLEIAAVLVLAQVGSK